jgi:hypothetical protein
MVVMAIVVVVVVVVVLVMVLLEQTIWYNFDFHICVKFTQSPHKLMPKLQFW